MYYSPYGDQRLCAYAELFEKEERAGSQVWCIFDNTAGSQAFGDAQALKTILAR